MNRIIEKDIEALIRSVAQLFALKNQRKEVEILAKSKAELFNHDYDNWNSGTYFYILNLMVPAHLYCQIEDEVESIQESILKRLEPLLAAYPNDAITSVNIAVEVLHDENWRKNALDWLSQASSTGGYEEKEEYDVFISHASEDKVAVVRPLAQELKKRGINVWYDEFSLTVGDSLRRSIDNGLSNSRFGIVVLSKAFFSKEWPQYELDGLVSQQMLGRKVILPIWHDLERTDVAKYSPSLADKLALSTNTLSISDMSSQFVDLILNKG